MPYSAAKLEPALIVKVYDRPDMRCVSCLWGCWNSLSFSP